MSDPSRSTLRLRRLWTFRLIAIALGLAVVPVFELVCIAAGWGRPVEFDDPYVGFTAMHPLFVLNDDGSEYHIAPSRRRFFAPEAFPARKPPGAFRIFCIGESTTQGHPYSKETAFPTWLQLGLSEADSSRGWEVINCGGVSYASYRLAPIVQECLQYEPDLIVLAIGHNEFLEDRAYGHLKQPSIPAWLANRRTVVLGRAALRRLTGSESRATDPRAVLPDETQPILDTFDRLKDYHHDDAWHAGVVEHYEFNLRRMIFMARTAGVPVIAIRQPSNLADCPPFKSEHRELQSPKEIAAWEQQLEAAQSLYRSDLAAAVSKLQSLASPDDRHAGVYYELGQALQTLHRDHDARAAFLAARDYDVCPLRMITPLEDCLQRVCKELRVPLLDAHALLESRSPHGILGGPLLVDHVHPSFEGHQLIADALIELMHEHGWTDVRDGWQAAAHAAYRRHFATLDEMYFLRGQRTLNSVRAWTQGKAGIPPMQPDG